MRSILLIDDDELVRATIARILESDGFEVLQAEDGRAGLKLFERMHPSLVITDILMPEMEGLETIREFRRLRANVRILAISGGARLTGEDFLGLARSLGADETLAKPFGPDELIGKIRQLQALA